MIIKNLFFVVFCALLFPLIGKSFLYASTLEKGGSVYALSDYLLSSDEVKNFLLKQILDPSSNSVSSALEQKTKVFLFSKLINHFAFAQFVSEHPCTDRPYIRSYCIEEKLKLYLELAKKQYAIDHIIASFLLKDFESYSFENNLFNYDTYYYTKPSPEDHLKTLLSLRYFLAVTIKTQMRKKLIRESINGLSSTDAFILDRFNLSLLHLTENAIKAPLFGKIPPSEFVLLQIENVRMGTQVGLLNPISELTKPIREYFDLLSQPAYYVTSQRPLIEDVLSIAKIGMTTLSDLETDLTLIYEKISSSDSLERDELKKKLLQLKQRAAKKLIVIDSLDTQLKNSTEELHIDEEIPDFINTFSEAVKTFKGIEKDLSLSIENNNQDELESITIESAIEHIEELSARLYELSLKRKSSSITLTTNDFHNLFFNQMLSNIYLSRSKSSAYSIPASLGFSISLAYLYGEISSNEIHFLVRQEHVKLPKKNKFKSTLNVFLNIIVPPLTILDPSKISPIILNVVRDLVNVQTPPPADHGLILINKELR